MSSLVSINLVVLNGEKYIRHCLDSVAKQTYNNFEFNIWDNGSNDGTVEIIESIIENWKLSAKSSQSEHLSGSASGGKIENCFFQESEKNIGMWPAHEKLWEKNNGKYVVVLSVDVILGKDFIKNAVEAMERDEKIGALQAKIYQWNLKEDPNVLYRETHDVGHREFDTLGFKIEKSRRLTNIGQGVEDVGQFNEEREIFAVEGAVPVFRKTALEECRISAGSDSGGEIIDHRMFWYGDDLDIAWRMRMMGWKEIYVPSVIAYHDRSTTKSIRNGFFDYFRRVKIRNQIPIKKRRLDWANYRIAIMKNDFAINFLKDLPYIVFREIMVLGYALLFEQGIFLEIPRLIRLLPETLKKRKEIMKKTKIKPRDIRAWFK